MLEEYYGSVLEKQTQCKVITFKEKTALIAKAHQTASDLGVLFKAAINQPEYFVYKSLLHDISLSLFYATTGLYRQSYASQRVVLENAVGAIFYSAQLLNLRQWAEGKTSVSWTNVAIGNDGVFTKRFADAFMPDAVDDCEQYQLRAQKLYSNLSDFVHKHIKVHDYDKISFTYDGAILENVLASFDELSQVISFPFCVRYIAVLNVNEREELVPTIDALAGQVKAFQKIIGGQTE